MGGSPDSQDADHIIQAPRIQEHRVVLQGAVQHAVVRLVDPVHIWPRVAVGGRAREGELLVLGRGPVPRYTLDTQLNLLSWRCRMSLL